LFNQMFMVNPSGYWGAIKKINHTGKKYVAMRPRDVIPMIILEGRLILFILRFLKIRVLAPHSVRGLLRGCCLYNEKNYFACGTNTRSIT
jgi:hypothetical protein